MMPLSMRRVALALLSASLLLATLMPIARADESKVPFLVEKLKADDFRVRTNAALALGASKEDAAVQPLCGALADDSEVVRQAATAGLKRLRKPASLPCLKAREKVEASETVKLQITRAIETIDAASEGSESAPKANAPAKYYVALSPVQNRSDKAQGEVDSAVLSAVKKKLEASGNVQIAPDKEAAASAKAEIKKRGIKGFYLSISVEPFDYSAGTKATVRVAIFTYPGKDLRAEVKRGSRSTAQKGDKDAESKTLAAAAEDAAQEFIKNAEQL
jgi:HEAT repeats